MRWVDECGETLSSVSSRSISGQERIHRDLVIGFFCIYLFDRNPPFIKNNDRIFIIIVSGEHNETLINALVNFMNMNEFTNLSTFWFILFNRNM